eukprot:608704-Rhodomonas_salina.1
MQKTRYAYRALEEGCFRHGFEAMRYRNRYSLYLEGPSYVARFHRGTRFPPLEPGVHLLRNGPNAAGIKVSPLSELDSPKGGHGKSNIPSRIVNLPPPQIRKTLRVLIGKTTVVTADRAGPT